MQTTHQRQPARGVESRFANVGRAAVVMQDPDTTRDAERVVARLVALIKSLSFVTEEAVRPETVGLCERGLSVSFLCEPAAGWDRLPASWRDYLECDAARAHVAIQQRLACDDDAPDSLRAALSSVRECLATIPYAASHDTHPHTAIDPRLLRGMKGKKRAECAALAPLIAATARRCGATTVVDVGCGHGHLARVLAAHYALRVIGIDASDYHAGEARRKTDNVDAQLFAGSGVQFVQRRITAHTSAADVAELLRECATADCDAAGKQNTAARPRVLLVGLHTCGDLAPVMARLVCDAPHLFAGLVNVPCCYQKNYCGTGDGFHYVPQSVTVTRAFEHAGLALTEGSLMAACHAIAFKPGGTAMLSVYRCAFQLFMSGRVDAAQLAELRVPAIASSNCKSFVDYVRQCDASIGVDEVQRFWDAHGAVATARVQTFWSLKDVVGAAVECLLLYDRMLFARQYGHARLVRCLQHVSPRSVALIIEQ